MKALSTRWGLWAGLALVVAANALVLVRVVANRSGVFDARVELTQRELNLPYRDLGDEENTGLELRLDWSPWPAGKTWLDRARLAELSFDPDPAPRKTGERLYHRWLPRDAFVVLEMEGESWRRWLADQEKEITELSDQVVRGEATPRDMENRQRCLTDDRQQHSRLFAVDAGRDPAALRQRYPAASRFIVAPARLSYVYIPETKDKPRVVSAQVDRLAVSAIHVPLAHRSTVEKAIAEERQRAKANRNAEPAERMPRVPLYRAVVAWGSRNEPWLVAVSPLPAPAGEPGGPAAEPQANPQ